MNFVGFSGMCSLLLFNSRLASTSNRPSSTQEGLRQNFSYFDLKEHVALRVAHCFARGDSEWEAMSNHASRCGGADRAGFGTMRLASLQDCD